MGPMAPSQIRLAPLKRLTDGMINLTTAHWTPGVDFLISWQGPASAISPRACFDLTGACSSHICTLPKYCVSWQRLVSSNEWGPWPGQAGIFIHPTWAEFEMARVSGKAGVHEAKICFLLSRDPGLDRAGQGRAASRAASRVH